MATALAAALGAVTIRCRCSQRAPGPAPRPAQPPARPRHGRRTFEKFHPLAAAVVAAPPPAPSYWLAEPSSSAMPRPPSGADWLRQGSGAAGPPSWEGGRVLLATGREGARRSPLIALTRSPVRSPLPLLGQPWRHRPSGTTSSRPAGAVARTGAAALCPVWPRPTGRRDSPPAARSPRRHQHPRRRSAWRHPAKDADWSARSLLRYVAVRDWPWGSRGGAARGGTASRRVRRRWRCASPRYRGAGGAPPKPGRRASHRLSSAASGVFQVLDSQYGMYVWPCAVVLAQYLWVHRSSLPGKRVLEVPLSGPANTPLCSAAGGSSPFLLGWHGVVADRCRCQPPRCGGRQVRGRGDPVRQWRAAPVPAELPEELPGQPAAPHPRAGAQLGAGVPGAARSCSHRHYFRIRCLFWPKRYVNALRLSLVCDKLQGLHVQGILGTLKRDQLTAFMTPCYRTSYFGGNSSINIS